MEITSTQLIIYLLLGYSTFVTWLVWERVENSYIDEEASFMRFMLCLAWPLVWLTALIMNFISVHERAIDKIIYKYWSLVNWWKYDRLAKRA